MKSFYLIIFCLLGLYSSAQISDRSEQNCSGQQQTLHAVLGSGKALIISSQGIDCSICASKAPGWGNWAKLNKTQVAVWGAMTYTYSSNIPSCNSISNWVANYGWTDVFTFIDSAEYYFQSGTPRYLVYDPKDSTLIYSGASESQARSTALAASQVNLTNQKFGLEDLDYIQSRGQLNFRNVPEGNTRIEVYNLAGKKEKSFQLRKDHKVFNISDLPKGIYLLRMSNANSAFTRKIVIT